MQQSEMFFSVGFYIITNKATELVLFLFFSNAANSNDFYNRGCNF